MIYLSHVSQDSYLFLTDAKLLRIFKGKQKRKPSYAKWCMRVYEVFLKCINCGVLRCMFSAKHFGKHVLPSTIHQFFLLHFKLESKWSGLPSLSLIKMASGERAKSLTVLAKSMYFCGTM